MQNGRALRDAPLVFVLCCELELMSSVVPIA
jgi:hypothetical protein